MITATPISAANTAIPISATGTATSTPRPTRTPVPTNVLSAPSPTPTSTPYVLPTPDPSRGGPSIFPGLNPNDVFYLVVQYNDGEDYLFYQYDEQAGSICDESRPEGVRECNVDLAAFLEPFIAIPVDEYVQDIPAGINWEFDWDRWESHYSTVLIVMEIRAWDRTTDTSHRWWFGASPINDEYSFAYIRNLYNHFNYAIIDADKLGPLIGSRAPVK